MMVPTHIRALGHAFTGQLRQPVASLIGEYRRLAQRQLAFGAALGGQFRAHLEDDGFAASAFGYVREKEPRWDAGKSDQYVAGHLVDCRIELVTGINTFSRSATHS